MVENVPAADRPYESTDGLEKVRLNRRELSPHHQLSRPRERKLDFGSLNQAASALYTSSMNKIVNLSEVHSSILTKRGDLIIMVIFSGSSKAVFVKGGILLSGGP